MTRRRRRGERLSGSVRAGQGFAGSPSADCILDPPLRSPPECRVSTAGPGLDGRRLELRQYDCDRRPLRVCRDQRWGVPPSGGLVHLAALGKDGAVQPVVPLRRRDEVGSLLCWWPSVVLPTHERVDPRVRGVEGDERPVRYDGRYFMVRKELPKRRCSRLVCGGLNLLVTPKSRSFASRVWPFIAGPLSL